MALGRFSDNNNKKPEANPSSIKPDKSDDGKTIQQLRDELQGLFTEIKTAKQGKEDLSNISAEDKAKLRKLYTDSAYLAKKIYERSNNDEERKAHEKLHKDLLDRAASYGSLSKSVRPKTTFDMIKGQDEVKKLVKSFMFMAQNSELLEYYHLDGGLGMLLYGPPGTGKTMFAEAIANEMDKPLFIVTPADIFGSYVGQSEKAVRDLFLEIDSCPDGAILFIDECESIFSKRTDDTKDYKSAVTTELLQRINGFGVNGAKRIMIGATNRPDQIDPAYLRYKRFSHLVHVTPPDDEAIKAIIISKLKGIEVTGIEKEDIYTLFKNPTCMVKSPLGGYVQEKGYYSSADICGIIEDACRLALEKIERENIKGFIPITKEMIMESISRHRASIPQSMLDDYINFK